MPKKKKDTRGGKRPFSGRKKADYETKTIAFRVKVEHVDKIKESVKLLINNLNSTSCTTNSVTTTK